MIPRLPRDVWIIGLIFVFTFGLAYLTSLQQDTCIDRSHSRGIWELTAWPVKVAIFQMMAAFGLLIFSTSRRFASPVPYEGESKRMAGEYVSSMAELLQRSGQRSLVLESLAKQFHTELAIRTGHGITATRDEVLQTLEHQHPELAAQVRDIYESEAELRAAGDSANMVAMIRWARKISEIRRDWRRGS